MVVGWSMLDMRCVDLMQYDRSLIDLEIVNVE